MWWAIGYTTLYRSLRRGYTRVITHDHQSLLRMFQTLVVFDVRRILPDRCMIVCLTTYVCSTVLHNTTITRCLSTTLWHAADYAGGCVRSRQAFR
ncbi:hypothetical protein P167DRAFT_320736 [Morchella conica CCBAS932]|uniref:Uncharacterized protein n=1 Tax=Morchella conica CCBAS932 TaxID=1392247 RepID=A0A3N4KIP9_9PEZI|nr:hypothetical protein P167DRAFT_320736 [Morchella conica CCBAS932]